MQGEEWGRRMRRRADEEGKGAGGRGQSGNRKRAGKGQVKRGGVQGEEWGGRTGRRVRRAGG